MTIEEIRELIRLATEAGITELEVQRGEDRVRMRRGVAGASETAPAAPFERANIPTASSVAAAPSFAAAPAPAAPPAASVPGVAPTPQFEESAAIAQANIVLIKSPITGTFYECPSPSSPPFVQVGDRVQQGKVLCIIEAMKQMNEILAESACIVETKLVLDGQVVEDGEALFGIRLV